MSEREADSGDAAPGHGDEDGPKVSTYAIGLGLASLLTVLSFTLPGMSSLIWAPAIPAALIALAIAQMGVHLVFFLHIDTGPDNTNNTLALAFGVLIVFLVVAGSVWIMGHLNHNMMPMDQMMQNAERLAAVVDGPSLYWVTVQRWAKAHPTPEL